MDPILAGGQLITSVLIVCGVGVLLWAKLRDTRHLTALLTANRGLLADERTAQYAALTTAIAANQVVLVALLAPQAAVGAVRAGAGPATILVIEDDPDQLELARLVLSKAGYIVRLAPHAEAGLRSVAHDGLPDLIVADIHLPHMDGLEFVRQLRAAGGRMPILAYTGSDADASTGRREALTAGCNDFLVKSGESGPLLACVAQWLGIAAKVQGQLT